MECDSKSQIRDRYKKILKAADKNKSTCIQQNCLLIPEFKTARKIMIYNDADKEPATSSLLEECLRTGKTACMPQIQGNELRIIEVTKQTKFRRGTFNLREPEGNEIPPSELELIFIPLIAFDRKKNRIGRGKGYYDRLLKKTNATKAGVGYSELEVKEIPAEQHDVKMDIIITEMEIIR